MKNSILLILVCAAFNIALKAQTVTTGDSIALVALYNSTNGANWTNNTNWLTGNVDTWYGVGVSEGRVMKIELNNNQLNGSLPTEISGLINLKRLYLSNNQLSGSLPYEIGGLIELTELILENNQLSNSIPSEIGNLSNLKYLSLSNNKLTETIPVEIGNLDSLQQLLLDHNLLISSIPREIGNLNSLTCLYLQNNQLSGIIPKEIGSLLNLKDFWLSNNQLKGTIPSEIGALIKLRSVNFSNNQFSGSIPVEICSLLNLEELDISNNQLTGVIPTGIGNLSVLRLINLFNNQLSGVIPFEIRNLSNLLWLDLYSNQFTSLPDLSLMALDGLEVQVNYLQYDDLELNINVLDVYSPQRNFTVTPAFYNFVEKDTITLIVSVGGSANHYKWFKDGVPISEISDSPIFTKSNAAFSDAGTYICQVTNDIVTGLTLTSENISVNILSSNAYLSSLSVTNSTLSPEFEKEVFIYTANLPCDTTSPEISYNTESASATVTVNNAQDINSSNESERTATIVVTAEDGVSTMVYSIVFNVDKVIADAGEDQYVCESTTKLNAIPPETDETGVWSAVSGTLDIVTKSAFDTKVINLRNTVVNTFRWTITNKLTGCSATDVVDVYNHAPDTPINYSVGEICRTTVTLSVSAPAPAATANGYWVAENNINARFENSTHNETQVSNLKLGENRFLWTVTRTVGTKSCSLNDQITIMNNFVEANAGEDHYVCESSSSLNAIVKLDANGHGVWSTYSQDVIIVSPTSQTTEVRNLPLDETIFTWTVTEGICYRSDDLFVVNNMISSIDAGVVEPVCDNTAQMTAEPPNNGASGSWTTDDMNVYIQQSGNPLTYVANLAPGANQFNWTLTKGACSVTDMVTVVNNSFVVDAGEDREVCSDSTDLSATILNTNQTGVWTAIQGVTDTDILTPVANDSKVKNLSRSIDNIFRWTVTNNSTTCTATDIVTIKNHLPGIPVDQTTPQVCGNTSTLKVSATIPAATATGYWTVLEGGTADVDTSTDNETQVTNLNSGQNKFRWTVTNTVGTHSCSKFVDIIIENNYFEVDAGEDQYVCESTTKLNAIPPETSEVGKWIPITGSSDINSSSQVDARIDNLVTGVDNIYEWTVTNILTGCIASDRVTIFNDSPETPASLGAAQVCHNIGMLQVTEPLASRPGAVSSGVWTIEGTGTARIDNSLNFASAVTNLKLGRNSFRWTVTNTFGTHSCEKYLVVDVDNFFVEANAGTDGISCDGTGNLTAIIKPGALGSGVWTLVTGKGAGKVSASTMQSTTVTGLDKDENTFRWTVTKGDCTKFDEVIIDNNYITPFNPAVTNPGPVCYNTATLTALAAPEGASGKWSTEVSSIIFTDTANPLTTVAGLQPGTNVLTWTVTKGEGTATCTMSENVSIVNNYFEIEAGSDQYICSSTATFAALPLAPGYSGKWSSISGSDQITNATNTDATVTGLYSSSPNRYQWTVSDGTCTNFDQIIVENHLPATPQYTGITEFCSSDGRLQVTAPASGMGTATGVWTKVGTSTARITNSTNHDTNVTNLQPGENKFRWTVTNTVGTHSCPLTLDVTLYNNSVIANANTDKYTCDGNSILSAVVNPDYFGSGEWTTTGGAIIDNETMQSTIISGLDTGEGGTSNANTFVWTVKKETCSLADEVIVYNNQIVNIDAGIVTPVCDNTAQMAALPPTNGETGRWTAWPTGVVLASTTDPFTEVSALKQGANIFTWTFTKGNSLGSCTSTDQVTITNDSISIDTINYAIKDKTLTFMPQTTGNVRIWNWDFGDATTSTDNITKKTYESYGSYNVCLTASNPTGCTAKRCATVEVTEPPLAQFSHTFNPATPQTLNFTNESTGTITGYFWDFGDFTSSTEQNPTHVYSKSAVYDVCLTVTDSHNQVNKICKSIAVGEEAEKIKAGFTYQRLTDYEVKLTPESLSGSLNYWWEFGDGGISPAQIPNHTYPSAGLYNVCLTVRDITGAMDKQCDTVRIVSKEIVLNAGFSYIPVTKSAVKFFVENSGNQYKYYWSFGDGISSVVRQPEHNYKKAGIYEVCLTISDETARTARKCANVIVGESNKVVRADYTHLVTNDSVYFYDRSKGDNLRYYWTFGDGTTHNKPNAKHCYKITGTYEVCLLVVDTVNKESSQRCENIHFERTEVVESRLVADFEFMVAEQTANFEPKCIGNNLMYIWNFGDGNISTQQSPAHTYETDGFYNASLIALDITAGKQLTANHQVIVGQDSAIAKDCFADFDFYPDTRTLKVIFANKSTGKYNKLNWDFGHASLATDISNYSNDEKVEHQFPYTGYYSVTLSIADTTNQCFNSKSRIIAAVNPLYTQIYSIGNFDWTLKNNNTITFYNRSIGDINRAEWIFDDTERFIYTTESPEWLQFDKNLNPEIFHKVALNVWKISRGKGKGGSKTKFIYIAAKNKRTAGYGNEGAPAFDMIVDDKLIILGDKSEGSITEWLWSFGDGASQLNFNDAIATHHYADSGYYKVCLRTKSASGRYLEICNDVRIGDAQSEVITATDNYIGFVEKVVAYPNPTASELFITLPENATYQVRIIDMTGKTVMTENNFNGNKPVNISRLNNGLYHVVIVGVGEVYSTRFVKH